MKILFSVLILFSPIFLSLQEDSVVEWSLDTTFDFGLLRQGNPASTNFSFKNVSGDTIRIDNVRVGCGCTAPTWESVNIAPDSTGAVTIAYDAVKLGYFYKKIRVFFSNQRKPEILWIEGEVE